MTGQTEYIDRIGHDAAGFHEVAVGIEGWQSSILRQLHNQPPMRERDRAFVDDKRGKVLSAEVSECTLDLLFFDRDAKPNQCERDAEPLGGLADAAAIWLLPKITRQQESYGGCGWDDVAQKLEALFPCFQPGIHDHTRQIASWARQARSQSRRDRVVDHGHYWGCVGGRHE